MADWPRVAVMGGSIGGLTAALVLRDLGCSVDVYERSGAALQARGAGIVVLPDTERYIVEQGGGLGGDVAFTLPRRRYVDAAGATVHEEPCDYRFSSWNTVYRALLDRFDPDRYHLDHEVSGFEQRGAEVTVRFASGDATVCELLVCADGISSSARRWLLPEVEPVYAGYVAWRGTVPEAELSDDAFTQLRDAIVYQVLDGGHILAYPIPSVAGSLIPGERLANFVWYRNCGAGEPFEELMTDRAGRFRPVSLPPGGARPQFVAEIRDYAAAHLAPVLAEVVLRSAEPFVQVIYDIEVPRMAFGRVCLIGDAAWSVRPHVAAGTAKAAADAWMVRDTLSEAGGDVVAALQAWEPRQLALGEAVVRRSQRLGNASQFEDAFVPGDPQWQFGLYGPGR